MKTILLILIIALTGCTTINVIPPKEKEQKKDLLRNLPQSTFYCIPSNIP